MKYVTRRPGISRPRAFDQPAAPHPRRYAGDPSMIAQEIIDIGPVQTGLLDATGELLYRERGRLGFEIPKGRK